MYVLINNNKIVIISEVPILDHGKKEDILEGRKNCGRQCTSHADSPRATGAYKNPSPPPPGNVKKRLKR